MYGSLQEQDRHLDSDGDITLEIFIQSSSTFCSLCISGLCGSSTTGL